jgi:hypothetical protein
MDYMFSLGFDLGRHDKIEDRRDFHIGVIRSLGIICLFWACLILYPAYGATDADQIYSDPVGFIKSHPEEPQDPKLGSTLSDILGGPSEAVPIRGIVSGNESNQTMLVDIYVNSSILNETELKAHLKEIKVRHRDLIEANAYLKNISAIRNLPFVRYIDVPASLHIYDNFIPRCPLLSLLKVNCEYRGGEGVAVAVLDLQFYNDTIMGLELPKNIVLDKEHNYNSNDRHGTACCEIIGRIAPDIKLYQINAKGNTPAAYLDSVEHISSLKDHMDIVSCSLGSEFGAGLFDVHDDLYYAIENLTHKGTIWVNAAGNEAEKHWSGKFYDPDGCGFNHFAGNDKSINITLEKGTLLNVFLSWNDWQDPNYGYSNQDYNLYVLGSKREDRKSSRMEQKGRRDDFPQEIISRMIIPHDGIYQIMIEKKNATAKDTTFHLFVDSADKKNIIALDEYKVPEGSLSADACYDNVLTVGAINASSGEIMSYSSRGPTFTGHIKPDVVAPTNIPTVSYYREPFSGTSAATPVIAGCLALALNDGVNPQDLIRYIKDNATDLGPKGPDNMYGYGLIDMGFLKR